MQTDLDFTAKEARDEAIDRVQANNDAWVSDALRAVQQVAEAQDLFTSEDVWAELGKLGYPEPTDRRAMGAVLRQASRVKTCAPLGYVESNRKASHCRPVRQYRSLLRG